MNASNPLHPSLSSLVEEQDLSADEMAAAVGSIMDGEASPPSIAAFLVALRMKGEAISEVAGAARAMIDRVTPIPTPDPSVLLDTCGTGGDGLHTFNISTATAFVVAACGVPIAKHGNRSVSSRSGSADVLETLGVHINLSPGQVGACISEVGLGFCYAPLLHGAMKHAAPIRRELGIRTVFNLLGPLTNPARAGFQLLGVNSNHNAEIIAGAVAALDRKRVIVVCGNDELDEVSLWGTTSAFVVESDQIVRHTWTAEDFGLSECQPETLRVESPAASADVIRSILNDTPGPATDIVLANAAAALFAAAEVTDLKTGVNRAREAVRSGDAAGLLDRLIAWTSAAANS